MSTFGKINPRQLKRLQTLYGQLATHSLEGSSREARLRWASEQAGREIGSFSALTFDEGQRMIDGLQGQLGVKEPARKRPSRDQARRAGLDGRKDGQEFAQAPQVATAADLEVIASYYMRLGWSQAQFDGWLRSNHSPLGRRANPEIRTVADANRVRWALKGMLEQKGLWVKRHGK